MYIYKLVFIMCNKKEKTFFSILSSFLGLNVVVSTNDSELIVATTNWSKFLRFYSITVELQLWKRKVSNVDILLLVSRSQLAFSLSIEEAKTLISKLGPRYLLKKAFSNNILAGSDYLMWRKTKTVQYLPYFAIVGLNVLSIQFFKDNFVKNSKTLPILRDVFLLLIFCCICWLNIKTYFGANLNNHISCKKVIEKSWVV